MSGNNGHRDAAFLFFKYKLQQVPKQKIRFCFSFYLHLVRHYSCGDLFV